jgi:hypothetical protein
VLTLALDFGSENPEAGTPNFAPVGFNFPAGSRDIFQILEKPGPLKVALIDTRNPSVHIYF